MCGPNNPSPPPHAYPAATRRALAASRNSLRARSGHVRRVMGGKACSISRLRTSEQAVPAMSSPESKISDVMARSMRACTRWAAPKPTPPEREAPMSAREGGGWGRSRTSAKRHAACHSSRAPPARAGARAPSPMGTGLGNEATESPPGRSVSSTGGPADAAGGRGRRGAVARGAPPFARAPDRLRAASTSRATVSTTHVSTRATSAVSGSASGARAGAREGGREAASPASNRSLNNTPRPRRRPASALAAACSTFFNRASTARTCLSPLRRARARSEAREAVLSPQSERCSR